MRGAGRLNALNVDVNVGSDDGDSAPATDPTGSLMSPRAPRGGQLDAEGGSGVRLRELGSILRTTARRMTRSGGRESGRVGTRIGERERVARGALNAEDVVR